MIYFFSTISINIRIHKEKIYVGTTLEEI